MTQAEHSTIAPAGTLAAAQAEVLTPAGSAELALPGARAAAHDDGTSSAIGGGAWAERERQGPEPAPRQTTAAELEPGELAWRHRLARVHKSVATHFNLLRQALVPAEADQAWMLACQRETAARAALVALGAKHWDVRAGYGGGVKPTALAHTDEIALASGFVLHPRLDLAADLVSTFGAGWRRAAEQERWDRYPTLAVGVLTDGRAVQFVARLSMAQATGVFPVDENHLSREVLRQSAAGQLILWWFC